MLVHGSMGIKRNGPHEIRRKSNSTIIDQSFNITCILLTRSSSFSDERSSRMLSTFIGKQNGVSFSGKLNMIFEF
jgi:hypothetical protein